MLFRCPVFGCPLSDPVWVELLVGVPSRGCSMSCVAFGRGLADSWISMTIVNLFLPCWIVPMCFLSCFPSGLINFILEPLLIRYTCPGEMVA